MFVIEVPYFDLNSTYNSKQVPRWIKLHNYKYLVPYKDKTVIVEQNKDKIIFKCTAEEFYNLWFNYFDLETDYSQLNYKIQRANKKYKVVSRRGKGIHILNQDPFECYIYCKLVEFVGYDKAKHLLLRIAQLYGIEHYSTFDGVKGTWYQFPTHLELYNALKKEKGRIKDFNKLKRFLYKLCKNIITGEFDVFEDGTSKLFKVLGNHELNVLPLVGIEGNLEKNFKCSIEEVENKYLNDIVELKGLFYLYVLHHKNNPPKNMRSVIELEGTPYDKYNRSN